MPTFRPGFSRYAASLLFIESICKGLKTCILRSHLCIACIDVPNAGRTLEVPRGGLLVPPIVWHSMSCAYFDTPS